MKIFLLTSILFLTVFNSFACEHLRFDSEINTYTYMGKKSKFYDAYKQGKCVLDNALKGVPIEQRKVIANIIAKTYKLEDSEIR